MPRRSTKIDKTEVKEAPKKRRGRPRKNEVEKVKKTAVKVRVGQGKRIAKTKKVTATNLEKRKRKVLDEIEKAKTGHNEYLPSPRSRVVYERETQSRIVIMWAGVAFFMILIGGFWIYNTKKVFEQTRAEENESSFSFDEWSLMTEEISKKMSEMKKGLEEVKNYNDEVETGTSSAEHATSTENDIIPEEASLSGFPNENSSSTKNILLELRDNLGASTTK